MDLVVAGSNPVSHPSFAYKVQCPNLLPGEMAGSSVPADNLPGFNFPKKTRVQATYFKSATQFRAWLSAHHNRARELVVGFYKKGSGRTGLGYEEAVEEALCFGWIDGLKRRVDDYSYTHRFTPRRPRSTWSLVNIERAHALAMAGRMTTAGLRAFAARDPRNCGNYSFENRPRSLPPEAIARFKADPEAWHFFTEQPPGYRRSAAWWIISAKRQETRDRRLARLVADSARQRRLALFAGAK